MKVTLVQMVEGQLIPSTCDLAFVEPFMTVRGYQLTGFNANPRQRAELQGAPKFAGLAGPMWNGDGLRYEDAAAYRALSV